MIVGELGHWWRSLGGPPPAREVLSASAQADVAIVGAGFTGLWSAYYLKRAQPSLRVVVLERETAGYGASGRNGGWLSGFFSGPARAYERRGGPQALRALQRHMFDAVDEVARTLEEHDIDAELTKDGVLAVALDDAQAAHLRSALADARARGLGEQDMRWLDRDQLARLVRVDGARAATFSPHAARVHPAKLVAGLAATVRGLGVSIHERTPVTAIRPGLARTRAGDVRARWVIRATEGYTPALPGLRRALVPINSSMIVTERLDAATWAQIGWRGRELMSDAAHVYVYLQRTEDGRIAIGGRGVPYRFGSGTGGRGDTPPHTVASLRRQLVAMFPALRDARIDHAWSGVLGVPRDWCPSVDADPRTGLAWAGGYVGEGVAASNLAARILCDLVLGRSTELTALPWVGHRPRRWEPEPLRWAAIRSVYGLYRRADARERRSGRPSLLGRAVDAASGRQ